MKKLRIHIRGKSHLFLLPENWCERRALTKRGYVYADLIYTPIPWWKKPHQIRDPWWAHLVGEKIA